MGAKPTKAAGNVWCEARLEAAKYNTQLSSRERAAEIMGYHPSTVAGWELGTDRPSPEAVLIMADTYNAPHLCNHFCVSECPLGKDVPAVIDGDLDRLTLRALGAMKNIKEAKENLIDITADGKVTEDELPILAEVLMAFDELSAVHNSLKIWYQKNSR